MYKEQVAILVKAFGKLGTYTKVSTTEYNIDLGAPVSTSKNYPVLMAKSNPRFSDVQSPNLINQEVSVFYIASCSEFSPSVGDSITFESQSYRVQSIQQQRGLSSEVAGWRLLVTKA